MKYFPLAISFHNFFNKLIKYSNEKTKIIFSYGWLQAGESARDRLLSSWGWLVPWVVVICSWLWCWWLPACTYDSTHSSKPPILLEILVFLHTKCSRLINRPTARFGLSLSNVECDILISWGMLFVFAALWHCVCQVKLLLIHKWRLFVLYLNICKTQFYRQHYKTFNGLNHTTFARCLLLLLLHLHSFKHI